MRLAVAAILVALMVGGCGKPVREPTTLVISQLGEAANIDPAAFVHAGDLTIIAETYQRLIRQEFSAGVPTGEFEGELAESWKVSDDHLTYVFRLKPDQYFSDGTNVDARAVKWSFERIIATNRAAAQYLTWIDAITVADRHTVRIRAKEPFPAALTALAYSSSVVMNPASASAHETEGELGRWLSTNSAGSGPYQVDSWRRGEKLVLTANTHYGGEPPFFRRVIIKTVSDPSARRIQLRKRDVDFVQTVASTNAHYYSDLDGIRLHSFETENQPGIWILNTRHPVVGDVRVRQAIAYGVDYDGLIDDVLDGRASRLTALMPEGVIGRVEDVLPYRHAPDHARRLLADAGYPDGAELDLMIGLVGPVSETMQSFMADIGIRLNLEIVAAASFYDRIAAGDFAIAYSGAYFDFLDPWAILRPWYHSQSITRGTNYSCYSNPDVDRLLETADSAFDPDLRARAYRRAQQIIAEDTPYILLFSGNVIFATLDDIRGIDVKPLLPYRLGIHSMYRIGEHEQASVRGAH